MKFTLPTKTFIIAGFVLSSLTPAFAFDVVTKKSDGKKISGTITAISKNDLTIKRTQGEETIDANDVAAIEWDGGGPSLKLAYSEENSGQLEAAAKDFQKAKADAKSPSSYLSAELDYNLARVQAKQALTDPEKREQAIQKLIAVQKASPDHFRFFDSVLLLSQLQLAAKDDEGLQATLEILKKSPRSDLQLAALIGQSRVLMNQGKIDEAISGFESAASQGGDSPADVARKYEARLCEARCLIAQTKFDEALKILDAITDKAPADDAAVQAEAYVLAGQTLHGLGRNKEAALAYLHVDILFPRESNFHAESLYQLSHIWKLVQHPDRSAEATQKLVQLYPNSEWRKKLVGSE